MEEFSADLATLTVGSQKVQLGAFQIVVFSMFWQNGNPVGIIAR